MATANFKRMEYGMPLVTGGMNDFEEMKSAYEQEYGEEYTEFMYEMDIEEEFNYAKELAEEFTENLIFHDVTVKSGYYQGFQFYVEEKYTKYFDLDKNSEYCIENDDAHYYFDMCRSKALRAADAEKRKIEKWLNNLAANGFEKLVCIARCSNGEAIYKRA